ncbi:hypothetical protein LCM20_01500 [Halobacillus litoralis]|uniref:CD3324 family protein n=1 Tax=Halobacillus litoralis TaxID=45668 RepID=UPI001CD1BB23|nr:hypothetical protein [Halobacillus litoralis]
MTCNAKEVLPKELMKQIQQYIQGDTIYIPKLKESHHKWGTKSGVRKELDERNESIRRDFRSGVVVLELAERYCLSVETIKKIVYVKR